MNFPDSAKALGGILALTVVMAFDGRVQAQNAIRSGFDQSFLDRNDDGSTGIVPMGFQIDFFGNAHSDLYVNNNGNVTFNAPQSEYSPKPLSSLQGDVISPFWADVDTRSPDSAVVTYGTGTVDGYNAFGVNWVNVGYYAAHADLLLSCQLVIIDRSDLAAGDFDLEFNYDKVQWQWGDVTVGVPPRAGFASSGIGYELPGSGVLDSCLDSNLSTGLIHNDLNSSVLGRYVFSFRDGMPAPVPEPTTLALIGAGLLVTGGLARKRRETLRALP